MKVKDYWLLNNGKVHASLRDISVDDSDRNNRVYMTDSKAIVVNFVLVYNADKNPMNYRERLALAKANQGKLDFCRFGLAHLRGFCFKSVAAYNQEEFEKKIVPNIRTF